MGLFQFFPVESQLLQDDLTVPQHYMYVHSLTKGGVLSPDPIQDNGYGFGLWCIWAFEHWTQFVKLCTYHFGSFPTSRRVILLIEPWCFLKLLLRRINLSLLFVYLSVSEHGSHVVVPGFPHGADEYPPVLLLQWLLESPAVLQAICETPQLTVTPHLSCLSSQLP